MSDNKLKHDTKLNIYQRLLLCMDNVRYLQRDITKKINNSYTSVSHDQVTRAVSDVFIKYGIYPKIQIIKEALELITVKKYDKFKKAEYEATEYMVTIQVIYELINVDNPEDRITINGYGQGQDGQDKAFGKAISYACKYALLKGLSIETGDDPDKEYDDSKSIIPQDITPEILPTNPPLIPDIFTLDDGTQYSKAGFAGIIVENIQNIKNKDDLVKYEKFKEDNKREIHKFLKLYPNQIHLIKSVYDLQIKELGSQSNENSQTN